MTEKNPAYDYLKIGLNRFVIISVQGLADDIKQLALPIINRFVQMIGATCCSIKGDLICFKWIKKKDDLDNDVATGLQEFIDDYGCQISFTDKDIQ